MKRTVYLSLGSNLGDRESNIEEATTRLAELGTVKAKSSLYETEPVEVEDVQPLFLNCAVALETQLEASEFLRRILAIEQEMGRRRTGLKAPRNLDIDIIFFGAEVIDTAELRVPHPRMQHRRFVLEPLAEIAPEFLHPVLKRTILELRKNLPETSGSVRRIS